MTHIEALDFVTQQSIKYRDLYLLPNALNEEASTFNIEFAMAWQRIADIVQLLEEVENE